MSELLVADIGGTGSRLGFMIDGILVGEAVSYTNADYHSFDAILADFLRQEQKIPAKAALAVAGPVHNQSVQMTNLGWSFSAVKLSAATGIAAVEIINDFAALAWSTLSLEAGDLFQVGGGSPRPDANRAIIGPGTGLGVSGLIHGDNGWSAMAGEGGHVTLSATTHAEAELIAGVSR
ncbi:MAG: glucokinase, partial [Gammaproteobacteria bacterium]